MKKLLLVLSLITIGLSGCYVRGYHDVHHRDGDHHGEHHDRDRDHHDRERR